MKNLTSEQIEAIGNVLHEHVQFYDQRGDEANGAVITEIESTLKAFPLLDLAGPEVTD